MEVKNVTIRDVDISLWRDVRKMAIDQGTTVASIVEEAIKMLFEKKGGHHEN